MDFCLRQARRHASQHEAQDIAQDALARAWRFRARCSNPAEPWGWLAAIVRNEAFRSARAPAESLDDVASIAQAVVQGHEERVVERLATRRALRTLSSSDRELLWLRYGLDLKQREIAELLNRPEGTVKVQLHRARGELRAALRSP